MLYYFVMKQEECFNKETENKKKQKQERIDEPLFVNLILINILIFLLSGAFVLSLFVFLPLKISHYISLATYTIAIIVDMLLEYKYYKEKFRALDYTYENVYLFKKYIALCELFIVVAIAFLIGLVSPFFSLYENELMKYFEFFVSTSLAYLSCALAGTKCMLDYVRSAWIADNQKKGNELTD